MKQSKPNELKSWRLILGAAVTIITFVALLTGGVLAMTVEGNNQDGSLPNIVLVHGAWADGSSWSGVIQRLQKDGYNVTAPQFPLTSTADDVARLRQVLAVQEGPTIVAGHSYGGPIITTPGTDAPHLCGFVYIPAF